MKTEQEIILEQKLMRAWAETVKEKVRADDAIHALTELNMRVNSAYDFNADPDRITLMVGTVLQGGVLPERVHR